jgi:hypothetical protein
MGWDGLSAERHARVVPEADIEAGDACQGMVGAIANEGPDGKGKTFSLAEKESGRRGCDMDIDCDVV